MALIDGGFCMIIPYGSFVDEVMIATMVGEPTAMKVLGVEHPATITSTGIERDDEGIQRGILVEFAMEYPLEQ